MTALVETRRRTRPGRRWSALLVALVLATAAAASGCAGDGGGSDYEAVDLRSGKAVSVDSLQGEPAVLVSWATWCKECDEILAGLAEFSEAKDADGIRVVAVNLDAAPVEAKIDEKIARHDLTVELWRDRKNRFKRSFGALGVPTTVVLGRDGSTVATFPGAVDFADTKVLDALEEARRT